jgi:class 3 adenylate cyclase/predicted ATPase
MTETGTPVAGERDPRSHTPERRADKTAQPEPNIEAERRHLTVMFCDLVESAALGERLDPEDFHAVVRAYQEGCEGVIGHYKGHIAQYLGDGLLVYFGYPQAHEDDAERAVRAGLEVVRALEELNERLQIEHGVDLAFRIGSHSGLVVAGEIGGAESIQVLGHTMNVAARLQGIAEPGTVVISDATLRLVAGVFVTRELGPQQLKGIAERVAAHRVIQPTGVRSRLDVAAVTGLTPFVGREQELGLLEDRWRHVLEGWGQVALICGEAGIGKSRLMHAFREHLAQRAHTWLECHCSPYTEDSALHPVLELQRQALGFKAGEGAEAKLERLEAGLRAAGFELSYALPLMAAFHSLALPGHHEEPLVSPEGRRKQTLELLGEWLLRLGREQPMVLLMEDLHWMDPSTLELLGGTFEQIARAPVLLLLTHRPDFEPPWAARSHLTPLLLARLTRDQTGDLIRKAARERELPEPWVTQIVRRADGVPFFAEELTKAVMESNPEPPQGGETPELQIPETLQDSLMARLDALGPAKELAQLGAVLGREFSYELLLEVSSLKEIQLQEALADAVREELLYQQGKPPEATYLFRHALIRDAAYQSLVRATRQRHHQRVAHTLIDRMPEVAEAQPELVAYHLTEAGEGEAAITYWQRAGERANGQVAHEEAIQHLRRGLALLARLAEGTDRDQRELGLQVALGRALMVARGNAHTDTRQAWERARSLCDPVADPLRAAAIHFGLFNTHITAGDPHTALEVGTQLIRMGEHAGETVRIAGHYLAAVTLLWLGRFRECRDHLGEVISRYDPEQLRQLLAGIAIEMGSGAHAYAGWADWFLGFPDRAWATTMDALSISRRSRQPFGLAGTLVWAGILAVFRRDWAGAQRLGAEATRLGRERGFPMFAAGGRLVEVIGTEAEQGDPRAADAYASAMTRAAGKGNRGGAPLIVGKFADLHLTAGQLEKAAATVEGALAIARQTGQRFYDAELHRQKGEIFLRMPEHSEDEAEALFREAIDIARSQEAKSLELRTATSLARLWQRQGRKDEARALLSPVYGWFTEGFDTRDLREAKALLDQLS